MVRMRVHTLVFVVTLLAVDVTAAAGQSGAPAQAGAPAQGPVLGPMHMKGNLPPSIGGMAVGLPAPTPAQASMIAEIRAFEQALDDAAVKGDTEFLKRGIADSFIMTHGDGWIQGESPIKIDTKQTWLDYTAAKPGPYVYRKVDPAVQVELHGEVAITIGKYTYLPRSTNPNATNSGTHLYVWFERVYIKRNGQWQFLSHRTVTGPGRELDVK